MKTRATKSHIQLVSDIMQSVTRIPRWKLSDMRDEFALLIANTEYKAVRDTLLESDEQASRLLKAIETTLAEINAGRCVEAGLTLSMALQAHKQRLAELTREE